MKIDKVLFTTSVEYSDFWNINSEIFYKKFNIEPVCILFGDINKTTVSEKYGKVINMPVLDNVPRLLQITWYKFFYPIFEPETTWLIGDIDMLPLQTFWFKENLLNVDDDFYVHLNENGAHQQAGLPYGNWISNGGVIKGGADLPGYYHVAKGKTFKKALNHTDSFEKELEYIISSKKYGLGHFCPNQFFGEKFYWCAEEHYTTELIRQNILNNNINFKGFTYEPQQRVDRGGFINNDYTYDMHKLQNNMYVDAHCMRPYRTYEKQNINLLKHSKMLL